MPPGRSGRDTLVFVFKVGEIGFGDNVRIGDADATRRSGHANLVGVCFGMSTPTVTRVEVVGYAVEDVALNVHFDDEDVPDAWFAPELVILVDHAAGSRATVGDQSFVKGADGEWVAEDPKRERRSRPRHRFKSA